MIMKNMKLKSGLFAFGALAVAGSFGAPALAQSQAELKPLKVAMAEGNYAGTFICSSGEMGMSLSLKDTGPASIDMIGEEPCRSGSDQLSAVLGLKPARHSNMIRMMVRDNHAANRFTAQRPRH